LAKCITAGKIPKRNSFVIRKDCKLPYPQECRMKITRKPEKGGKGIEGAEKTN